MVMTIYRLVTLRNFIRSCGKCTICYETSRLQALHDRDYRHGICSTCKASYNRSECHMCRKSLGSSTVIPELAFRPALTIDTGMNAEQEAFLDSLFDLSDEAMERERSIYLNNARENLEAYLDSSSFNESRLRNICRDLNAFLDFDPLNITTTSRTVMVRENLNVESLLFMINAILRYKITYEQAANAIASYSTNPGVIMGILDSVFDVEKCVRMICDIHLPNPNSQYLINRVWLHLQYLELCVNLHMNSIDVIHDCTIDLQSLYNIFASRNREDSSLIVSTILAVARIN